MWNWLVKLQELGAEGAPVVMVTVTQCTGSTPREPGAKMLVLGDGRFFGTIGGGNLEQLAIDDAKKSLETGQSRVIKYPLGAKAGQCCGGTVELFFEVLHQGPRLYVFGAGHVGQAVCRVFAGTPFVVHLIDEREEWIGSDTIPAQTIRHHCEWDDFVKTAQWSGEQTYAVVMTYRHDLDEKIIKDLVGRAAKYLGLIGSRAKWERFKHRLSGQGISQEKLDRVKCPLGLDIGDGKTPQEIAISLAAEAMSVYYGKALK
ncbi:xanthine dehydrogenase accessory protein XdhC [Bdellovibrionota bacterium FG-1]